MADIPNEMQTREREPDPHFTDNEILYRRFPPDYVEDGEVVPESFALPDMSVNRGKYGPPEWAIIHQDHATWGVSGFRVEDIPRDTDIIHLGVIIYALRPEHCPLKYNYPHTEVRVFRDSQHICAANDNTALLEPEFHIRWRERLSQLAWIVIQPSGLSDSQ
jgi:hypothetical protein